MKIPDIVTPDLNFWSINPQLKLLFSNIHDNDKSKDKKNSSLIMWGIYHYVHPQSEFYNLSDKDDVIKKKWLKDANFSWVKYKEEVDLFKDMILTQAERSLVAWNETMKKRDEFMHTQEFTLDEYGDKGKIIKGTADQLDAMLGRTAKLYADYFKIKKELSDEEIARGRGNKPLSESDSNEI